MLCRSVGSLALYAGDVWASICDDTIATQEGMDVALRSMHMKVCAGDYTPRHFYRTLVVGVLGLAVPGDELYSMGCSADDTLFEMVLAGRGVDSVSGFNELMAESAVVAPVAAVGLVVLVTPVAVAGAAAIIIVVAACAHFFVAIDGAFAPVGSDRLG
jgi:hypothetical protein